MSEQIAKKSSPTANNLIAKKTVLRTLNFRKNMDVASKLNAQKERITSLIASDAIVEGVLRLRKGVKVDGIVIGGILIESDTPCMLFLNSGGQVEGNVLAPRAIIAGEISGSIRVNELLVLGSAKIDGDIFYQRLHIEDGASVNGRLCRISVVVEPLDVDDKCL